MTSSVPPFNMSSASMTVNGKTYSVTVSSQIDQFQASQNAFDGNPNSRWQSAPQRYDPAYGLYRGTVTTTVSGTAVLGEWIQLQMPVPLVVTSYTMSSANKCLASWVLAGSADGVSWYTLDERSGIAASVWNNTAANTFTLTAPQVEASYMRLILRTTTGSLAVGGDMFSLTDLRFAGTTGGPPDRNVRS
jgi:hypothetical protein